MAIGYNGPRGQTLELKVSSGINGSAAQNIYLETVVSQIQPLLKAPFILDVIKNTTGDSAHQDKNSRYYYNKKSGAETLIAQGDDRGMVTDPRTLGIENISEYVAQLAPQKYAKKLGGMLEDLKVAGLENAVSVKIADYLEQSRRSKQIQAFESILAAAKQVQKLPAFTSATTLEGGAHLVTGTYTDGKVLTKDLSKAIISFKRFGAPNASLQANRDIPYCLGINAEDMLILLNEELAPLLFEANQGLYASDTGLNQLFRDLNIKKLFGVPLMTTTQLPAEVNFMIIATGTHGTIGYEEIGNVANVPYKNQLIPVMEKDANMVLDPNWSGAYRIDIYDNYKLGVILKELAIVSVTSDTSIPTWTGEETYVARPTGSNTTPRSAGDSK